MQAKDCKQGADIKGVCCVLRSLSVLNKGVTQSKSSQYWENNLDSTEKINLRGETLGWNDQSEGFFQYSRMNKNLDQGNCVNRGKDEVRK